MARICIPQAVSQDCTEVYEYLHPIEFQPRIYHAVEVQEGVNVDGEMDEESWSQAAWSEDFLDIEGELRAAPERKTNVKILYDDRYLYIGAKMEEDHLWYTLTKRDAIIYNDDDIEVFIDANGDGHNYQEFEVNVNNVLMDLWLLYPYRVPTSKHYLLDWDPKGVRTAVHVDGTVNKSDDTDAYWSLEMAIPLEVIGRRTDFWRINFSRVDWLVDKLDGSYRKVKGEDERNWVWSPIGHIDMHRPETWGYLAFEPGFKLPKTEKLKWEMWRSYHALMKYRRKNGNYPADSKCISVGENIDIEYHSYGFSIIGSSSDQKWVLDETGLIKKKRR